MKLIFLFLKSAVMKEIEYRKSFYIGLLTLFIETAMILISTLFFYTIASDIGGWNRYAYFILLGNLQILQAISYGILYPNLGRLSIYINEGDLDYILLKPKYSLFLVSVQNYSIMDLPQGIVGVFFIIYGMVKLDVSFNMMTILWFFFLLFLGICILYSLFLIMVSFSFYTEKLSNIGATQ